MVHRPSDSRLLVNLLSHEKEYSKQLVSLLDQSQSCLASFSAYASASPPPTSQIIIQVAGALAGADEALRKYGGSLEYLQEQLKGLKGLEDEVGNVMRDREILVTRLIKLSKSQKSTRDSILASSSSSTLTKVPEVQTSTKLASAQSGLQACEAHLASKERELDVMRNVAIKAGLTARFKALVECGWAWGEMGKEGLRALEALEGTLLDGTTIQNGYIPPANSYKPLPDGPSSDLSSIGPSQSASQDTHGYTDIAAPRPISRLFIPPAHSISDNTFPMEDIGEGSSAGEEVEEGAYEVKENERFAFDKGQGKLTSRPKANGDASAGIHTKLPFTSASSVTVPQIPKRQRRTSGSVLGSIAAFFHHKPHSEAEQHDAPDPPNEKRQRGKWQTRTDNYLARGRKGKGKADSDSDDDITAQQRSYPVVPVLSSTTSPIRLSTSTHKLKKSVGDSARRSRLAPALSPVIEPAAPNVATMSDTALEGGSSDRRLSRRGKKKTKRKADQEPSSPESAPEPSSPPTRNVAANGIQNGARQDKDAGPTSPVAPSPAKSRKQSGHNLTNKPNGVLPAVLPTEVSISLSRNSSMSKRSITSAASAPVNLSTRSPGQSTVHPASPPHRHASTSTAHKRSVSLDVKNSDGRPKGTAKIQKRNTITVGQSSLPPRAGGAQGAGGENSLMSIVEGVTRQNREARAQRDPNQMLFLPKAPPPISESLRFLEDVPTTLTAPRGASSTANLSGHSPGAFNDRTPSERSIPLTPSASGPAVTVLHKPSPDLKPLRSALRNTSRSPSPVIAQLSLSPPSPSAPVVPARSKLRPPPTPQLGTMTDVQPGNQVTNGEAIRHEQNSAAVVDDSDASSISSYETTQEIAVEDLLDEEDNTDTPLPTPHLPSSPIAQAAPPVPPKVVEAPAAGGSQISQSTSSTNTATNSSSAPVRRKSVRMSLPPTFSATPPAFDDDENGRGRSHEPWSSPPNGESVSWRSKIKEPVQHDVWRDSSDSEEEEYRRAKRLLTRLSKKK